MAAEARSIPEEIGQKCLGWTPIMELGHHPRPNDVAARGVSNVVERQVHSVHPCRGREVRPEEHSIVDLNQQGQAASKTLHDDLVRVGTNHVFTKSDHIFAPRVTPSGIPTAYL
jgi:hypothetical protein